MEQGGGGSNWYLCNPVIFLACSFKSKVSMNGNKELLLKKNGGEQSLFTAEEFSIFQCLLASSCPGLS